MTCGKPESFGAEVTRRKSLGAEVTSPAPTEARARGGSVTSSSLSTKGQYIKVKEGDTLCGLARAFFGEGATCAKLRAHLCNLKLRTQALKADQKVFIPEEESPDPKHRRELVSLRLLGGTEAGLTITTRAPSAHGECDVLDTVSVEVDDPLVGDHVTSVTFDVLYPYPTKDNHKPEKGKATYAVCPPCKIKKPVSQGGDVIENARSLSVPVHAGKATPIRLVTQDRDRLARPTDTLLIRELAKGTLTGEKLAGGTEKKMPYRVEILEMKVRATYQVPSCNCKPTKDDQPCSVTVERPLDPGKIVKLAIWILRTPPTGAPPQSLSVPVIVKKTGVVVADTTTLWSNLTTTVGRLWAQARVQFDVTKIVACDPPSEMIAVGDWDGIYRDPGPSHLPPNGKSAADNYTPSFDVTWKPDGTKAPVQKRIAVTITRGSNPQATAGVLVEAINAAFGSMVAFSSPNPKQTNATQESCDVVLCPPTGTMTLSEIAGATDADQKVHAIRLDKGKPVVSNFPESYHIGSPQFRLLMKAFKRDGADVKIVFAGATDLQVASGGDALGFGLGKQRDFPRFVPSEEVGNAILAGWNLSKVKDSPLLTHELGHVLIDTAGHAELGEQLMFGNPASKPEESIRIRGYRAAHDDWETPVWDETRSALSFTSMPRSPLNAVERVHGHLGMPVAPAELAPVDLGKPISVFEELDASALTTLQTGVAQLAKVTLGDAAPEAIPLTFGRNYLALRNDRMNAWYQYHQLFHPALSSHKVEAARRALLAALLFGSTSIQAIIAGDDRTGAERLLRQAVPETTGAPLFSMRDFIAPRLARILKHSEFRTGFYEVSKACADLGPGGAPLVGFTGSYPDEDGRNVDTVFATLERFGCEGLRDEYGRTKQPGPNRARHCYTTLHESLHLHSHQARGFQANTIIPDGAKPDTDWKGVLDEGATELLTRLVYYHSHTRFPEGQRPEVTYFGYPPARLIPAYEVVKNVVAQMSVDVGLPLLAGAYFLGDFGPFFKALKENALYDGAFWGTLSDLSIDPPVYMTPESSQNAANDKLAGNSHFKCCLKTADIFRWMADSTYYGTHDPAFGIYRTEIEAKLAV